MKSAAKLKICEKTNSGNYVARCLFTPLPPNPPLFLFGWRGEGRKGGNNGNKCERRAQNGKK